jgi:hypothetical protein
MTLPPAAGACTTLRIPFHYGCGSATTAPDGDSPAFPLVSGYVEPPPESNRRPHPYHGTTGNRCADRRSPRSRSTVGVKVIGSPSTQLCGHSPQQSSEQYGSSSHSVTASLAASRMAAPSTSSREVGIPRPGRRQGPDPIVHIPDPAIPKWARGLHARPWAAAQHRALRVWRIGSLGGSVKVAHRATIGELDRLPQNPSVRQQGPR